MKENVNYDRKLYAECPLCSSAYKTYQSSVCWTHIEDGDDRWIIPADYGGNVFCFWNFGRDQLKMEQRGHRGLISEVI